MKPPKEVERLLLKIQNNQNQGFEQEFYDGPSATEDVLEDDSEYEINEKYDLNDKEIIFYDNIFEFKFKYDEIIISDNIIILISNPNKECIKIKNNTNFYIVVKTIDGSCRTISVYHTGVDFTYNETKFTILNISS